MKSVRSVLLAICSALVCLVLPCLDSGAAQKASGAVYLQSIRVDSLEEGQQVLAEIKGGKSFDEVAESRAPEGLKGRRGYLGEVPEGALVPAIRKAISGLQPGVWTGVIEVEGGYLILRLVQPEQRSAYESGRETAQMHLDRGLLLGELGDTEGEIGAYRRALEIDPEIKEGYVNLGEALRRKAMRILGTGDAAGARPDGAADLATNLLDEAIDDFKIALVLDPDLWEARYDLGLAYAAEGLLDLTVLEFQEALRLRPNMGELHRSMALVLFLRGDQEQAAVYAQRARELGVDMGEVGRSIEKAGKNAGAARKPAGR